MIKTKALLFFLLIHTMISIATAQKERKFTFEELGKPIRMNLPIELVTKATETGPIAWAGLTDAERSALIGVHMESGQLTQVDLTPYGKANSVLIFKHNEQTLYLFAGNKGRFLKYDIPSGTLSTVGPPSAATYWVSGSYTVAPDGKIYVGTFPQGGLSILDPATEQVEHKTHISTNAGMEYIIKPVSDADGIIYLPHGMHHGELWSFNPTTKEQQQLLPEDLQTYGAPVLWKASDGKVYGKKGNTTFSCMATGITPGPTQPAQIETDCLWNGKTAVLINENGHLEVKDNNSKQTSIIKSTFVPSAKLVFSISDVHNGKLYGSSMKPGHMFSYDLQTGELRNMGRITRGSTQIYDLLSYGKGLFTSSYTGGYIEYFDPSLPKSTDNPRLLAYLHKSDKQERPVQLTLASDGNIYSPTAPIKGHLGGTLVQIDPKNMKTKTFKDLIPNQSYTSVTDIPETDEIFVTSSISGGSSAKPTEKEAWVFLWNTKTNSISYKTQPITAATSYTKAVRATNGNIYGFTSDQFYVFDPIKREIQHRGEIKVSNSKTKARIVPSEKTGTDGLLYLIDSQGGHLLSIDPSTNSVQVLASHPSLQGARFAKIQEDGYLYYPSGSSLMRVRITNNQKSI